MDVFSEETLSCRVADVLGVGFSITRPAKPYATSWDALMPDLQAWLCREDTRRVGGFWFALYDRMHTKGALPARDPADRVAFRLHATLVAVAVAVASPEDVCHALIEGRIASVEGA